MRVKELYRDWTKLLSEVGVKSRDAFSGGIENPGLSIKIASGVRKSDYGDCYG